MQNGLIQIYTGNGKGKTTAAVGQVIRASGHKAKICFIQIFKPKRFYGEQKILSRFKNIDFFSFSHKHPFCYKNINKNKIKKECRKALCFIKKIFKNNSYDILVLDEFNIAIRDNFIRSKELIDLLKQKPTNLEVVITGRKAPKELIEIADLVTEMKKIKHPYDKGITFRKLIEF